MCKQKMLCTFSLHMVPKGETPLETGRLRRFVHAIACVLTVWCQTRHLSVAVPYTVGKRH